MRKGIALTETHIQKITQDTVFDSRKNIWFVGVVQFRTGAKHTRDEKETGLRELTKYLAKYNVPRDRSEQNRYLIKQQLRLIFKMRTLDIYFGEKEFMNWMTLHAPTIDHLCSLGVHIFTVSEEPELLQVKVWEELIQKAIS